MSIHISTSLSCQSLFFFCLDLFSKSSDISRSAGPSLFKFSYPFLIRFCPIFYLSDIILGSRELGLSERCILDRLQNLLSQEMSLFSDHMLVCNSF